jgi:hypothetical protein
LHPTSCFYLALWPTDVKYRAETQKRIGFCFAVENGKPVTFYSDVSGKKVAETQISNFVDGNPHKVKIVESQLSNKKWRSQLFLDDMFTPQFSVENDFSIAAQINAQNDIGFIEFQINVGSPSSVKLFNWLFGAF